MYNTHTQRESVPWSGVAGPRSLGYDRVEEEDALKLHDKLTVKMHELGFVGSFVVTTFIGEEFRRTQI